MNLQKAIARETREVKRKEGGAPEAGEAAMSAAAGSEDGSSRRE